MIIFDQLIKNDYSDKTLSENIISEDWGNCELFYTIAAYLAISLKGLNGS